MERLETIQGQIVGLDTAPLIYFMEKHPVWHPKVRPFFLSLSSGHFTAVTSTVTLIETLVYPLRKKETELARRYKQILLNSDNLTTFPLTPDIATKAAELRAKYDLRTPDAIQIATAISAGASSFLANDHSFKKVEEIQLILPDEL